MSVVTVARYRALTGDTSTAASAVEDAIDEATDLLVDALGREVVHAERTERLEPTRDGWVWPTVVPITAAPGWTVDGYGLRGTFGPAWPDDNGRVEVTYSGGWVERTANPDAAHRLPAYIERDLAYAAHALVHAEPAATSSPYPDGAVSVSLGDASVTFGPDGPPSPSADLVTWSRRTLAWQNKTVRGAGAPEIYHGPWRT
jgi:hypothetical protein